MASRGERRKQKERSWRKHYGDYLRSHRIAREEASKPQGLLRGSGVYTVPITREGRRFFERRTRMLKGK